MSDAPGFVGRYRVVRPLGRGRLGHLFLAMDPAFEREVALRVVPPLSQEQQEQLRLSLRSIGRLTHPSLAPILDFGEHQGRLFFTRQYTDGRPLSRIIAAKTRIQLARRLEWMVSVCGALLHAHGRDLVGLVVEPSNLIIDEAGEAHIVDLGLGPLGADAERDPSYQAPETIAGRAPDRSSDIFAAGVLLYELITGQRPFGHGPAAEIRKKIADGAQWRRHDDLDPALEAIVTRALQVNPAARYQDLEEFRSDLRRIRTQDDDSQATVIARESSAAPSAPTRPAQMAVERMRAREVEQALVVANAALGARVHEKALEYAERALMIDPTSALAHEIKERARAALDARQIAQLLKAARQEIAHGSLEAATVAIDQALALNPADPEVRRTSTILDEARRERQRLVEEARERAARRREQEVGTRADSERYGPGEIVPPVDVSTARRVDDNVRFTVYRPAVMAPQRWYPLLFFTHLGERRPDAPPDEPDPLAQVEAMARSLLGTTELSFPRIVQDAGTSIPHEALLRIVPSVPGLTFNPPEYSFLWIQSVHKAEFEVRADATFEGRTVRGSIDVRMGAISVAFITVAIPVDARAPDEKPLVPEVFHPYRRIFASYSHKDVAIVRQFEKIARGVGDCYMRDAIDLRSGEIWNDRLLQLIDGADVFQLFWSSNSMDSPFVRREWEHALTVKRSHFVRPLYWESPFPQRDGLPPPELKARHFANVAIADQPVSDQLERRHRQEKEEKARPDQPSPRVIIREEEQPAVLPPELDQGMIAERRAPMAIPSLPAPAPASRRLPTAVIVAVFALLAIVVGLLVARC